MKRIPIIVLLFLFTGCGGDSDTKLDLRSEPISVKAWKELEIAEKYSPEMLARLQLNDAKLANEKHWHQFMREVVVPERRKDIPTNY